MNEEEEEEEVLIPVDKLVGMAEHKGELYIATSTGLYKVVGEVLKEIRFACNAEQREL